MEVEALIIQASYFLERWITTTSCGQTYPQPLHLVVDNLLKKIGAFESRVENVITKALFDRCNLPTDSEGQQDTGDAAAHAWIDNVSGAPSVEPYASRTSTSMLKTKSVHRWTARISAPRQPRTLHDQIELAGPTHMTHRHSTRCEFPRDSTVQLRRCSLIHGEKDARLQFGQRLRLHGLLAPAAKQLHDNRNHQRAHKNQHDRLMFDAHGSPYYYCLAAQKIPRKSAPVNCLVHPPNCVTLGGL